MDKDAPDHHPCSSYMENYHDIDVKIKPGTCRPRAKLPAPLPSKEIDALPVKVCCLPAPKPPDPPDACKQQRIRNLLKAGYKVCPMKAPPPPPPPPASCLAICKERIKNFHPASDSPYPSKYPSYPR